MTTKNSTLHQKIRELAKAKKAIILAHNYQSAPIQDVADLCGDSLEMSIKAAATDADIIICCGVRFMAETAAILCPDKIVLMPNPEAGCPMADMVTPEALVRRKGDLGGIPVITYVNSSAAVKAVSDICCTSANVIKVVNALKEKEVLMTPDRNLARYAAANTDKKIHLWDGYCPFHNDLSIEAVKASKAAHPKALFVVHPECRPDVLELADSIQSTSGMIRFAGESSADQFILGTETGLIHAISKALPEKKFFPVSDQLVCPDMKKTQLQDIWNCLENLSGRVVVEEAIRIKAMNAVKTMINIT
ncbi:MAG: quinolinate synthase NadA [Desulfobacter postgatei]|uniref:quinolinate synthase NadA n=1 Tax=Desulfobacter postgatei TaxID=2293 RepID=UPI0023EFAC18|nr:quinolinate synthase NadA [Desulfobacter postgatei]MDD4273922.1 quinolinate synthase NadA [Desulfobacter postgatei]